MTEAPPLGTGLDLRESTLLDGEGVNGCGFDGAMTETAVSGL